MPVAGLAKTTTVKMVCAASDCLPNQDNVTHAQVAWSSVQVQRTGQWVSWDSTIGHISAAKAPRYTIQQELPLQATLTT